MKRYAKNSHLLHGLIKNVFSQNQKKYSDHENWHDLYRLAQATNEIKSLRICKSIDPNMNATCLPIFIDGFSEPFFDEKRWAYENVEEEITFNHRPHITKSDLFHLYSLEFTPDSLPAVREIFMNILKRGENWVLVSGPISTGGTGDRKKNIELFHQHVIDTTNKNHLVFNQTPFEDIFREIGARFPEKFSGTENPILEEVYVPVLKSGHIKTLKMMPGWESSNGATREHRISKEQGIRILN